MGGRELLLLFSSSYPVLSDGFRMGLRIKPRFSFLPGRSDVLLVRVMGRLLCGVWISGWIAGSGLTGFRKPTGGGNNRRGRLLFGVSSS